MYLTQPNGNATSAHSGRRSEILTHLEVSRRTVPFDYTATATQFIISMTARSEQLAEAYKEHAAGWLKQHTWSGSLLTYNEVNQVTYDLLAFLLEIVKSSSPVTPPQPRR